MSDFNVTIGDIKEYIESHKNQLRFNEAFFVEYMRNNDSLTKEGKIIIIQKYNLMILPMEELEKKMQYLNLKFSDAPDFLESKNVTRNLDFKGIVYSLIPILKLNEVSEFKLQDYHQRASSLADSLYIPSCDIYDLYHSPIEQVKEMLRNCHIAGYLQFDSSNEEFKITLNKEECQGIINSYKKIYGSKNIKKIETKVSHEMKLIKELKKLL